jgi:hypothetical protein
MLVQLKRYSSIEKLQKQKYTADFRETIAGQSIRTETLQNQ